MGPEPEALSESQTSMLRFEARWPKHTAKKEEAIRSTFGIPASRYYQRLYAITSVPAALLFDAVLIHRIERARDERASLRARRTLRPR